jgi:hypothetical protein
MATATQKRQQRKPERHIGFVPGSWNPQGGYGILRIRQDDQLDHYFLKVIPCDFGHGFELTKLAGTCATVYHVALDPTAGRHSCECKGFLRWGHKTLCKHIAGLLALAAAGQFGKPAERQAAG